MAEQRIIRQSHSWSPRTCGGADRQEVQDLPAHRCEGSGERGEFFVCENISPVPWQGFRGRGAVREPA